jgi:hypothetical protein
MRQLITINDVRKHRQLGKQLNDDNFEGRVLEVQTNELTDLLGRALSYDFFNFLDNGFTAQAGSYTRDSDLVFTAVGQDLSLWVDYAIKINDSYFGVVETAVFGGADTVITLTKQSDVLPNTISTVEFATDNKYIKLLNGAVYNDCNNNPVDYNGLIPFISWKLLAIFVIDGSIKHSDVGNFTIKGMNFNTAGVGDMHAAKSIYLQNSSREENKIIDYLNTEDTIYPLWESKKEQNTQNYNFFIV